MGRNSCNCGSGIGTGVIFCIAFCILLVVLLTIGVIVCKYNINQQIYELEYQIHRIEHELHMMETENFHKPHTPGPSPAPRWESRRYP